MVAIATGLGGVYERSKISLCASQLRSTGHGLYIGVAFPSSKI